MLMSLIYGLFLILLGIGSLCIAVILSVMHTPIWMLVWTILFISLCLGRVFRFIFS